MKKMMRFLGLFSLMTCLAFPMTACTIGPENEFTDSLLDEIDFTADETFSGELKIVTTSEDSEIVTMNAIIAAFNQKYPNITVKYTQELLDNYYSSLITAAGTATTLNDYSDMPDVYWIAHDKIDSYFSTGSMLFPLSKVAARDEKFNPDILVDEAIDVSSIDGEMYMMPRDFNQVVMYFNQDIFDAAHVAYPKPQMSREQFMTMLSELRTGLNASEQKNGYGVLYREAVKNLIDVNSQWDSWVWPLVKSFGGEVVNSNGESALNSDNVYQAVDFWKSLRADEYVGPIQTTNSGVNFRMQQSAIYFHARAVLTDITHSTKQIKGVQNLGVTAIPQFGPNYAVGGGSSGYAMYLNAENKTAAWLFLKFVVSDEGQEAFSATGNGIPSVKTLLSKEDASWRRYTSDALGDAFDPDAFVYGLDFEDKPFTSTRDFFKYIPTSIQTDVLTSLQSCFAIIDSANNSPADIKNQIANQSELIDYYIKKANR